MRTTTLFVTPLKPGKLEEYKEFLAKCMGAKKHDYAKLLNDYDLNNLKMWLHKINNQDIAIFTHDMGETGADKLANWPNKDNPFEMWFDEQLKNCLDFDAAQNNQSQPEFFAEFDANENS